MTKYPILSPNTPFCHSHVEYQIYSTNLFYHFVIDKNDALKLTPEPEISLLFTKEFINTHLFFRISFFKPKISISKDIISNFGVNIEDIKKS